MARNQYRRASRHGTFLRSVLRTSTQSAPSVIPIDPTEFVFTTPDSNLSLGETLQLSWAFRDRDGNDVPGSSRTVTFSTSAATTASVSTLGVVLGNGIGVATITGGSSADSLFDTVLITVTSPQSAPSTISYMQTIVNGQAGGQSTVQAYIKDAQGTPLSGLAITWSSTSDSIFTVGSDNTASDPLHSVILSFVTASASTVTLTATV